ncbi:hypothetical protein MTX78_24465 (plasmid) [Hymenobacter tibetensis]|uniref:Uncharacterized protein n=1 Tax=Hymenobacter tibetensis TaxID=497967 RepID=A0ABY4D5G6_9BACT|nr:hypothetical protein [Hymenobacter tibetensis]UOG77572.1 hypothetical protein MTX78_24465 [Hymenobacter tibetensis]
MKHTTHSFKTVATKGGKQYVEVKDRLLYLAHHFEGEYSIETDYRYFASRKMWVVKATVTLTQNEATNTYTGLAQELESEKYGTVNNTSALENAETSAVGRALAMAGIGIESGIASADEVRKAESRAERNKLGKPEGEVPKQAASTEAAALAVVTDEQKAEMTRLLTHEAFTEKQRAAALATLPTMSEPAALQAIQTMKGRITEHESKKA